MKNKQIKCWAMPKDFRWYGVEFDYETYTNCRSEGCSDEGICRCGKIENTHITSIDIQEVFDHVLGEKITGFNEKFWPYCLYRLLVIHKIYEKDSFEVNICGGYYGEEVDSVTLENHALEKNILHLRSLDPQDRVKFVLEKEYGYLLPKLEGKIFKTIVVNKNELEVPNFEYYKKVNKGAYNDKYNLELGIYIKGENKYKLIDGYHRYVDLVQNSNKKEFKIIVAE